jgi:hypothetical protein
MGCFGQSDAQLSERLLGAVASHVPKDLSDLIKGLGLLKGPLVVYTARHFSTAAGGGDHVVDGPGLPRVLGSRSWPRANGALPNTPPRGSGMRVKRQNSFLGPGNDYVSSFADWLAALRATTCLRYRLAVRKVDIACRAFDSFEDWLCSNILFLAGRFYGTPLALPPTK